MSKQPKQEWRIEAARFGWNSKVFLNDEDVGQYIERLTLELIASGTTKLTVHFIPTVVHIITDPELHLIVGDRRFRVIEETPGDLNDGLFRE